MTGELHTAAEAAGILKVRESWLKTKAAARLIPCTFIGKHLRFSDGDIAQIMAAGACQPISVTRETGSPPADQTSPKRGGLRGKARQGPGCHGGSSTN